MLCINIRAVLTGRLTISGFDLAWFSCLSPSNSVSFGLHGVIYIVNFILVTSLSLPFSELSPAGLALDVVD